MIDPDLTAKAAKAGLTLRTFQSAHAGELIDCVHAARTDRTDLIINPGAFADACVALGDALAALGLPFIEVHLSGSYRREPIRLTGTSSDSLRASSAGSGQLATLWRFRTRSLSRREPPSKGR
jgi:3-dehydroquinate dehydratase-2